MKIKSKYKDFPLNFMNMKIAAGEGKENQFDRIFIFREKKLKFEH